MTVNFTTTQQKVVFTDTDGAVTFTATQAPVVFTAAISGPQGDSHVKIVDWGIKRDTSNATTALDPIGDFANWEAAAPAYWNLSDGDRVGFNDRITPTQSGIYDYTAGVGFTRSSDADTYDKLNGAVVVGKTNRYHTDLTTVSGTPAYLELMAVFIPRSAGTLGSVAWDADWFVDRKSYEVALSYAASQAALRQPANVVVRGSYVGASGNYTIGDDVSGLFIFGSHGTVTMPAAANNTGKRVVISTATNAVTINTAGADAYLPAANTSVSIAFGTTISYVSLGALNYWWTETRAGSDYDIPFWNGASIAENSFVAMVAGVPSWDNESNRTLQHSSASGNRDLLGTRYEACNVSGSEGSSCTVKLPLSSACIGRSVTIVSVDLITITVAVQSGDSLLGSAPTSSFGGTTRYENHTYTAASGGWYERT